MNPVAVSMATIAVSAIYIVWHNYRQFLDRRERTLRSRVAFMLWCAANRDAA